MYTEDSIMPSGKYHLWPLKHVPKEYLKQIYLSNAFKENAQLRQWLEDNIAPLIIEPPQPPLVNFICTKLTYPTEAEARFKLKIINKDGRKHKKPVRAYECKYCSGWHLTSQEDPRYKESTQ